jgi:hypothetical protein
MWHLPSGGLDSENKTHFSNSFSQQSFRYTGYITVFGFSEAIHNHNSKSNFRVYISKEFVSCTARIILTEGTDFVRCDRQTDRQTEITSF